MSAPRVVIHRIHHAWVVCFACCLMLFVAMGMNTNLFSVYTAHMIHQFGFTNSQTSLITTCRCLASLGGMLTVNRVCAKLGLRQTVALGLLLQVASRILFGITSSFPAYCFGELLGGVAYAWAGMVPLSILMGRWFKSRYGLAVGIGAAGSGLATILLPPVVNEIVENFGLHFAFLSEAALTLVLTLLVVALIHDRPQDIGLEPYHDGPIEAVPRRRRAPVGMTSRRWAAVLLAVLLMGGPMSPGCTHISILFTTAGYSTEDVSVLLSLLGLVLSFSKIAFGSITDRIGSWRSNFFFGILFITAHALFALVCSMRPLPPFSAAAACVMLYALSAPECTVAISLWARDLSGDDTYEETVRRCNVLASVGALVFSPMPGMLADHTGSYVAAYLVFTLSCLICLVIIQNTYFHLGLNHTHHSMPTPSGHRHEIFHPRHHAHSK